MIAFTFFVWEMIYTLLLHNFFTTHQLGSNKILFFSLFVMLLENRSEGVSNFISHDSNAAQSFSLSLSLLLARSPVVTDPLGGQLLSLWSATLHSSPSFFSLFFVFPNLHLDSKSLTFTSVLHCQKGTAVHSPMSTTIKYQVFGFSVDNKLDRPPSFVLRLFGLWFSPSTTTDRWHKTQVCGFFFFPPSAGLLLSVCAHQVP